jgi:acyl carrier protein
MTNFDKAVTAFREGLGLGDDVDVTVLEYNKIQNWDSVAHMTLVAAIEEAFDIMFDTDDVLDMSSFNKALEIIARHDVDFDA